MQLPYTTLASFQQLLVSTLEGQGEIVIVDDNIEPPPDLT